MDSVQAKTESQVTGWRRKRHWVITALVVALLLFGMSAWALIGRSSKTMHWYTGPLHHEDFKEAKQYFRNAIPAQQRLVFNNLYLNKTYGIHNVCGELNSQQANGAYTGFLLFYVEIVNGSPEKVNVVTPDLDAGKTADWETHCGEGEDAKQLGRERFYRNLLTTQALIKRWGAEQDKK